MKSFLYLLLFYQDTGFVSNGEYYIKSNFKNLIKILISKKINKYEKILCVRNIFFKILSIIYIPIAIILFLNRFKIYPTTPNSIGSYFEQLEIACNKEKNVIILSPALWTANFYIEDLFFKKKFILLKNNIINFLLIPLTFLKFLRISFYDYEKNLINQKQYFKNNMLNDIQFEHEIIFKLSSVKKNHEIIHEFKIDKNQILNFLKEEININPKKKLCVIHLRNEKNDKIRNNKLINYIDGINYLIKNNFEVLIFSDQKFNFNNDSVKLFDLKEENKKIQIYSIILCDIFLGPISGPFHVAKFLNKNLIITDCVVFNHYIYHDNFNIIYKKYLKNNKIMNFNEIFKNNIECVWDIKILDKLGIEVVDNTNDEILNSIIEFNKKDLKKTFNSKQLKAISNEKKIFNSINYFMMRNTSDYFIKKNYYEK